MNITQPETIVRTALVVDGAKYQPVYNTAELAAGSVVAAISKCGQGGSEDPTYEPHRDATLKGGLIAMAYHWIDPTVPVISHLDFLKRLWDRAPASFLWLDFEQWWSNWGTWSQAILKKIQWAEVSKFSPAKISDTGQGVIEGCIAAGLPAGNYTSTGFVATYAPQAVKWLGNYPLWWAQYGRQPKTVMAMSWDELKANWLPEYKLILPAGIDPGRVVGHQFTGDCISLPGMYADTYRTRTAADVSVFDPAWLAKLGVITLPAEQIPTGPQPSTMQALYSVSITAVIGLKVHSNAALSAPRVGSLPYRSVVDVYEESDCWGRIESPMAGWISLQWTSKISK